MRLIGAYLVHHESVKPFLPFVAQGDVLFVWHFVCRIFLIDGRCSE